MRVSPSLLLGGVGLVHGALNLDGSQAVDPAPVSEDVPAPISDPTTYLPDFHDCPIPCKDYSNVHSWIPYTSLKRLRRCNEPMLLNFGVNNPLDDPKTTVLIRACSLASESSGKITIAKASPNTTRLQQPDAVVPDDVENPKKSKDLSRPGLETALTCTATGREVSDTMDLSMTSGGEGSVDDATVLLDGMKRFFEDSDNCDEKFIFGYHKETVAGIYVGRRIHKSSATSALSSLSTHLQADGFVANKTVTQLCGGGRFPERVLGVTIDTRAEALAAVQKTAVEWSNGTCVTSLDQAAPRGLPGVKVVEVVTSATTFVNNGTVVPSRNETLRALIQSRSKTILKLFGKRDTCSYIQVEPGDGCWALGQRCGISTDQIVSYNPDGFCNTLQAGQYACCTPGDPYEEPTPDPPQPNPDGTCATHLIVSGDSCYSLSVEFGVTVDEIESWNQGTTWAWTECSAMLVGYNMCLSSGLSPMPPPQAGTQCGPLVPGTERPSDPSVSLADINPCPLKSCCSNWGHCGVFAAHCEIHAPEGGGPGSKLPGFESSCISNCGTDIQQNSGPPAIYSRVGYYEAFNFNRDCLWLSAKDANVNDAYTHLHWGFMGIDPSNWMPIITDGEDQWEDFKRLKNVKRIISFGGWAYSTEAATYNILRGALIDNREIFATNVAQFLDDNGLDGVDVDWEYPGAQDIYVGGQAIGQAGDGQAYLDFLTTMKSKVGDKLVAIAAPASFWYLRAFPIDQIAQVIDYIVYMTYDLHGQWDYGKPNSFDSCDSGKCIRSHVNLTETRSALSMITKAGVPNNKIFIGEASYGRSFHMASDGCWGPLCEFTGTDTESDATPGKCTKTGGYLAYAEITEIIGTHGGVRTLHDGESNTDVMLYNGDYVGYMTPITKETRRNDWRDLNFAGTIDWAVDLQEYGEADMAVPVDRPEPGEVGCRSGEGLTANSGDLCEFSCHYGHCPEPHCQCLEEGVLGPLPDEVASTIEIVSIASYDVELNRLCRFTCKYGYCPEDTCEQPPPPDEYPESTNPDNWPTRDKRADRRTCQIFQDSRSKASTNQCKTYCSTAVTQAQEEGRTTNYGCLGFWEGEDETPWYHDPSLGEVIADGECMCDNMFINELADIVIEAMPVIAQIGCSMLMNSLKLVLDIGLSFIPGRPGIAIDAGLDMALTAAQLSSYIYEKEEKPEEAFSWWLSPCGDSNLVPDDIKRVFDILNLAVDGVSSFKKPKNIQRGSGKKGDAGNPNDQGTPRSPSGNGVTKKKCTIKGTKTKRHGKNHLLTKQSCVNDQTHRDIWQPTSIVYPNNAPTLTVEGKCKQKWGQACYHYSSVISLNPAWATLTCPTDSAVSRRNAKRGKVIKEWSNQHEGSGWKDPIHNNVAGTEKCERDEYPPAYLLGPNDLAWINSGIDTQGQLVRFLPQTQNGGAASMWTGACFNNPLAELGDLEFQRRVDNAPVIHKNVFMKGNDRYTQAVITVDHQPVFTVTSWPNPANPPANHGHNINPCWPKKIAPADAGFPLVTYDPFYNTNQRPYDYAAAYVPGQNGV